MLFENEVYEDVVALFTKHYEHHVIQSIREIEEHYIGFKSTISVTTVRKIDVIEKFILKLLNLPITQPKTLDFINRTLNIGKVFVQAYIEKLSGYAAITEQAQQYAITEKGKRLLETEEIDFEEKEQTYQFLYSIATYELFPWKKSEQLMQVPLQQVLSEEEYKVLVHKIDPDLPNELHVKHLEQWQYKTEAIFEIVAVNMQNQKAEKIVLSLDGTTQVKTSTKPIKMVSDMERQHATSALKAWPVHAAYVERKLLQARTQVDVTMQRLDLETLSLLQLNKYRKAKCPLILHYEHSAQVDDKGTLRNLQQYYMIKSSGKKPLYIIKHRVPFNAIVLDQQELFYQEGEQWFYHQDFTAWSLLEEDNARLWCNRLLTCKDEAIWYPLLERLVGTMPKGERNEFLQRALPAMPINFAHRLQKLLKKRGDNDAVLNEAIEQRKTAYYAEKNAQYYPVK